MKNKQLEMLLSNEEKDKQIKELENKYERLNTNTKEEIEEKNNQINELVSKLNDNEIQIKSLKYEKEEKIAELKKIENNIIEKENKINNK